MGEKWHGMSLVGLLVAEEKLANIREFILRIQTQQESLSGGFTVLHMGEEYNFVPKFIDR